MSMSMKVSPAWPDRISSWVFSVDGSKIVKVEEW